MRRPWEAEHDLGVDAATALVEEQFPELAPATLEPFGVGWDNTAYLVDGRWVFRFPRRKVAVELLETEIRVLPALAPRLPLPVPVPEFVGEPTDSFPWPFAGYPLLLGTTACRAHLDGEQREAAAEPLAAFLGTLHGIGAEEARKLGAGPDVIGRLDVAATAAKTKERLTQAIELNLVGDPLRLEKIVAEAPRSWRPEPKSLVHGDLYARHLLVDERGRPAGVIDWGDLHYGDPAVDLAFVHGFLPPKARESFLRHYGPVEEGRWRVARLRALFSALNVLVYGRDVNDEDLVREGRWAVGNLVAGTPRPGAAPRRPR